MIYNSSSYWSKQNEIPIVIYSGDSKLITPISSEFIGQISPLNAPIQGLLSTTKIKGIGTVKWSNVLPEEHQHLLKQLHTIFLKQTLGYSAHKHISTKTNLVQLLWIKVA